jgi:hypothetical protein
MIIKLSINWVVNDVDLKIEVRVVKEYHDDCERVNDFQRQSLKKSWRMCMSLVDSASENSYLSHSTRSVECDRTNTSQTSF